SKRRRAGKVRQVPEFETEFTPSLAHFGAKTSQHKTCRLKDIRCITAVSKGATTAPQCAV
ncbi:hypothetical protein AB4307_21920, partial [Vibrio sp. 10N.261.52.C2]|uniref:hypothetical protein n=1 Tax=Vibrio sp. 10N.261.52.C2 TaxID=3229681 RepID=UPI003551D75C